MLYISGALRKGIVTLFVLDLTDRQTYRAHTARLLRLVRRSRRDAQAPVAVIVSDPDDRLHLALWSLGAFKRTAIPAAVWLNTATNWPVVRQPGTLQYYTVDPQAPLSAPQPFPCPRFVCLGEGTLTVQ
jgi:hypothetical protein